MLLHRMETNNKTKQIRDTHLMWIVGDSKANQACGLKIKQSRY